MAKEVRADLGKPVEPFIERLRPEQRAIVAPLHRLITSAVPSTHGREPGAAPARRPLATLPSTWWKPHGLGSSEAAGASSGHPSS
jgi:hypothetical protein